MNQTPVAGGVAATTAQPSTGIPRIPRPGRLRERGSGGQHVVHQQDRLIRQPFSPARTGRESPGQVGGTRAPADSPAWSRAAVRRRSASANRTSYPCRRSSFTAGRRDPSQRIVAPVPHRGRRRRDRTEPAPPGSPRAPIGPIGPAPRRVAGRGRTVAFLLVRDDHLRNTPSYGAVAVGARQSGRHRIGPGGKRSRRAQFRRQAPQSGGPGSSQPAQPRPARDRRTHPATPPATTPQPG